MFYTFSVQIWTNCTFHSQVPEANLQMDKSYEASAPPPYYGGQAPPYPGNEPENKYLGSIQQPPPAQYGQPPTQAAGYYHQPPPVQYTQVPPTQYGPPPTQAAGYHQQQPPVQYTQGTPAVQPVVIVQAGRMGYGKDPMTMTCMHCQAQIQTSIRKEQGQLAWIYGGAIFIFGLFCCLCCLGVFPFFIDDLKRVELTCPNCKQFLGVYNGGM